MSRQQRNLPILILAALAFTSACTESPTAPGTVPGVAPPRALVASAATRPGYIRIGVVPSDTGISIGATGAFSVTDRVSGAELLSGSAMQVRVSLVPGTAETHYRLQVMWTTSAATRDAWIAGAQALGYVTSIEPYNGGWRLFVGAFAPDASWSVRNAFRNQAMADGVAWGDSFWKQVTTGTPPHLRLTSGAIVLVNPNPIVVTPTDDGRVLIAGVAYRGIGEIGVNSALRLAGINELPLEEYLYGVVPRELSPGQYPEIEAIKAQAIAARTYALAGMGKRSTDGYDLLATTSDQVYGGFGAEQAMSNQAVDETRGQVITYGGQLISALYHSTSGGWTADNEEVYASAPVAYLRGVPDAERGDALEHVPSVEVFRNNASALSLRAAHESDFESNWARFHRWSYEWSADELRQVLSGHFGVDVGAVRSVEVLERGSSGRVLQIRFVTDNGTYTGTKDGIRAILRFVDADQVRKNLPSTLFYIEPVLDSATGAVAGFRAWGGGFGHGIGMAQTGAVGMAHRGATHEEVLKHYYRDVAIETR